MRHSLSRADGGDEGVVQLSIDFRLFGERTRVTGEAPNRPVRPKNLLPLFRDLTNVTVEASEEAVRREGKSVSCRAGCGACCRQLVPVSHTEAHAIRDLVEDLPPAQRRATERRFADTRKQLADAGILADLSDNDRLTELSNEDYLELAHRYFAVVAACPFLVDESCSIHPERPLICREYLVTSPPELCSSLDVGLETVPLPTAPSRALEQIDGRKRAWVPLPLAIDWANANPDLADPKRPNEIVEGFAKLLRPDTSRKTR